MHWRPQRTVRCDCCVQWHESRSRSVHWRSRQRAARDESLSLPARHAPCWLRARGALQAQCERSWLVMQHGRQSSSMDANQIDTLRVYPRATSKGGGSSGPPCSTFAVSNSMCCPPQPTPHGATLESNHTNVTHAAAQLRPTTTHPRLAKRHTSGRDRRGTVKAALMARR